MSDKVARAVAGSPRRRFGFGTGFTILVAVVVLLASGALAATPSAHTVRRTAAVAGADVARLYLHESDTSILQPVEKLEGFQRVQLNPGESKTVTFKLGRQNLGFYNEQGQFVVEPGPFNLWVSDTSQPASTTICPASLPNGVSFNVS
jgi:beta-glucosidase